MKSVSFTAQYLRMRFRYKKLRYRIGRADKNLYRDEDLNIQRYKFKTTQTWSTRSNPKRIELETFKFETL